MSFWCHFGVILVKFELNWLLNQNLVFPKWNEKVENGWRNDDESKCYEILIFVLSFETIGAEPERHSPEINCPEICESEKEKKIIFHFYFIIVNFGEEKDKEKEIKDTQQVKELKFIVLWWAARWQNGVTRWPAWPRPSAPLWLASARQPIGEQRCPERPIGAAGGRGLRFGATRAPLTASVRVATLPLVGCRFSRLWALRAGFWIKWIFLMQIDCGAPWCHGR